MQPNDKPETEQSGIGRRTILKAGAAGALASAIATGGVAAHPDGWDDRSLEEQLEIVVEETEAYEDDFEKTDADGYVSLSPLICGMGFHFVNRDLIPEVHPETPASLVYLLEGGDLRLGAVEYIVPKAGPYSDDPPNLFNDEGEDLATSEEDGWVVLDHGDSELWTLHVWVHEENPEGVFHPTNPEYGDMPGCLGGH